MAGLEEVQLTKFITSFLAVRVAYTVVYTITSTQAPTVVRSGLWMAGIWMCFRTIIRAAAAMDNKA